MAAEISSLEAFGTRFAFFTKILGHMPGYHRGQARAMTLRFADHWFFGDSYRSTRLCLPSNVIYLQALIQNNLSNLLHVIGMGKSRDLAGPPLEVTLFTVHYLHPR